MQVVELDRVVVPEGRQRQVFSEVKLEDLKESILRRGLLHPITVQPVAETGQFILRAGERRQRVIRAITEEAKDFRCDGQVIPPGFIPVLTTHELDEIGLLELELDENIRREALTWQEEGRALAKILELKRRQYPGVSDSSVAKEISEATNQPVRTIRESLLHAELVAKHLDDPKVAGARNMREAYSILSHKIQNEFEGALRAKMGTIASSDHECYNDDCTKFLPTLQVSKYDAVITDPPYGMGADDFGTAGPGHDYVDDEETGLAIASCILREGFRLTKPEAHLYLFCDIDFFHRLRVRAANYGWTPFRTPLIWDKGGGAGHNPIPGQAIRRSYEVILFAYKGNRPALKMITDVIRDIPNVRQSIHAAEKPGRLFEHLLSRSCKPGDWVLDPCCGVGPVFEAGNALKLRCTGIELDKQFYSIADQRRYKLPGETQEEGNATAPADL